MAFGASCQRLFIASIFDRCDNFFSDIVVCDVVVKNWNAFDIGENLILSHPNLRQIGSIVEAPRNNLNIHMHTCLKGQKAFVNDFLQ